MVGVHDFQAFKILLLVHFLFSLLGRLGFEEWRIFGA